MELFEEIRRGYAAGETIKGLAKKHGVHRRMVRQAIASAIPPASGRSSGTQPKLDPVKEHIDQMLEVDRQAPRKQRHTAHRIWTRLREEHPEHPIGEPTVRRYVRRRKQELGLSGREVFVPQSYDWGQEAQVDWFEAMAQAGWGSRVNCSSSRCAAWRRETHSIEPTPTPRSKPCWKRTSTPSHYFGGVFRTLRYDNMAVAGKEDPARTATDRDRPDHRVPLALGISKRVLQPGQRQRKGWRGRRAGLVPAQLSGAGAGSRGPGGVERTVIGGVRREPQPDDQRQGHDGRAKPASMSGHACLPLSERGFPIARDSVSAGGGWQRAA